MQPDLSWGFLSKSKMLIQKCCYKSLKTGYKLKMNERKKYGLKAARREPQFSKPFFLCFKWLSPYGVFFLPKSAFNNILNFIFLVSKGRSVR